MIKKSVTICDRCNIVIASQKCEICDKDICVVCQEDVEISLHNANGGGTANKIMRIISCKNCSHGLTNVKLKSYFDDAVHKKVRQEAVEIFKNALLVNSLHDKEQLKVMNKVWTPKKAYKVIKKDGIDGIGIGMSREILTDRRIKVMKSIALTNELKKTMKGGQKK